ncbi:MAG TPA: MiaB/RimO family radical SAM methylthiotransferase [Thermoanaerobaculia bacterium]|jgi:threonylcarbamoyladenosine tRNA methylthiotransferase MtaB|nr:MiaB/RimO family radical SAM methylthiotransferase [Thermoanaerobaculia bacterium]
MRVYFTNLGCKLNQAETERWARDFAAAGWQVAAELDAADLHVVHSCTVTAEAERSSRRAAGRGARKGLPQRTVLAGCYATSHPEVAARAAGVDLIVSNRDKGDLLGLVNRAFPDLAPAPVEIEIPCSPAEPGRTRSFLKVEDGCDMRCAFCIIPSVRGGQRSRPLPEVVAELLTLAPGDRPGAPEIVVTGVQISSYRWQGLRLPDLVAALLDALPCGERAPRLRLSSIAPWEFDRRLLPLFADPRLCRHLHLSLQSGAAPTLKRMRRPYTPERYARLLGKIRAAVAGVAITTDVIAGFPGESDEEFEESLAFVTGSDFAKIHAFPYSSRPGTEAASLPGQLAPETIRARNARLVALAAEAERRHSERQIGRQVTVLWENPRQGPDGSIGQGLTDDYVRVLCPEAAGLAGRFAEAELIAVEPGGVTGRLS